MRKFILKSTFIILPLLGLLWGGEILIRDIPNDYSYKNNYLEEKFNELEILVLGSSHSYYGIDPKYLNYKGFNAAHVSQTLKYDFEILKKYENRLGSLKAIILPISYFTFWSNLNESESQRIPKYSAYYGIDSPSFFKNYEMLNSSLKYNLNRIYRFYSCSQSEIQVSTLGFGLNYNIENKYDDWLKTGADAAKRHTYIDLSKNKAQNIKYLNQIVSLCRQNDINLFIIHTPTHESYREYLNSEQKNQMIQIIDSICLSNQETKIFRLNYFEDRSFDAEDYYDADHLSNLGAIKLTNKLNIELSKVIL